jgi:hypothetical protein
MAFDHESWLRKQGVKIVGRHALRRAVDPGYMDWGSNWADGRIDWSAERYTVREECVYTVELDQQTIEKLERMEADVHHAIDYANRKYHTARGSSGYTGGPSDVTQFFIDNKERHLELLQENSMYRDAWKEFQSIRVLLGESPHWP